MVLESSVWKLKSASTLETSGHDEINPTICFTIALVGPLGNGYKGTCGAKHRVAWRTLPKQSHPASLQSPKYAGEACGNGRALGIGLYAGM